MMSVETVKLPRIGGEASRPLITGLFVAIAVLIALLAWAAAAGWRSR